MTTYYTESGTIIRNPEAYARTGAPMYKNNYSNKDINQPTSIYKMNLKDGKKYIGKTTNIDRRMKEHFTGHGSRVTKKFAPKSGSVVDECPGFFADELENYYTDKNIDKYGYDNVRGGRYVNSKTLKKDDGDKVDFLSCNNDDEEWVTTDEDEDEDEDEW